MPPKKITKAQIETEKRHIKNATRELEEIMQEQGFSSARVISHGRGKTFFRLIFSCNYCPFCKRKHERGQAYYNQSFGEAVNLDGTLPIPNAWVGCFRADYQEYGHGGNRKITFSPFAESLYEHLSKPQHGGVGNPY